MHNLVKIRQEKGLSQADLSKIMGVTRAGMSYIEKHTLNLDTAKRLADALEVSVFELLGEDNFVERPSTRNDKKYLIKLIKGM